MQGSGFTGFCREWKLKEVRSDLTSGKVPFQKSVEGNMNNVESLSVREAGNDILQMIPDRHVTKHPDKRVRIEIIFYIRWKFVKLF